MSQVTMSKDPGTHAVEGPLTIRKIEPIGGSNKVVWLHFAGCNQAIKTLVANLQNLGIQPGAEGDVTYMVREETFSGQTNRVSWLNSFAGQPADIPEPYTKPGNGSSRGHAPNPATARIRAIGDICAHAPLDEIQQRIDIFNQAAPK